jgi:hypothetical protein
MEIGRCQELTRMATCCRFMDVVSVSSLGESELLPNVRPLGPAFGSFGTTVGQLRAPFNLWTIAAVHIWSQDWTVERQCFVVGWTRSRQISKMRIILLCPAVDGYEGQVYEGENELVAVFGEAVAVWFSHAKSLRRVGVRRFGELGGGISCI